MCGIKVATATRGRAFLLQEAPERPTEGCAYSIIYTNRPCMLIPPVMALPCHRILGPS